MKRTRVMAVCILTCLTVLAYGQSSESLLPTDHFHRLTHLVLKDGTYRVGWFVGTMRDSLILQIGPLSERYSCRDLVRVVVEHDPAKSRAGLNGTMLGAYLGALLVYKTEGQDGFFAREGISSAGYAFGTVAFAVVGGCMGLLVASNRPTEQTFNFGGTEEEDAAAWLALTRGVDGKGKRGTVHFAMQGSWVSGPIRDASEGRSYNGASYSSTRSIPLNLMRKIQLTYSLNNFLDVGLATVWVGQPTVTSYQYNSVYTSTSVSLKGTAYYVVGVFQPLWKLGLRDWQLDVGAGAGVVSSTLAASVTRQDYSAYPGTVTTTRADVNAHGLSVLLFTEVKVFVTNSCSLGLTADYATVPEDVPGLAGFSFERSTLSTTSVGFVVALHL